MCFLSLHYRWIRAFYYAARMLSADGQEADRWASKLSFLPHRTGRPAIRWAYRKLTNRETRSKLLEHLAWDANAPALLDLVGMEGAGGPAEKTLIDLFNEHYVPIPPRGAEMLTDDDSPPAERPDPPRQFSTHTKLVLHYQVGRYEVERTITWIMVDVFRRVNEADSPSLEWKRLESRTSVWRTDLDGRKLLAEGHGDYR